MALKLHSITFAGLRIIAGIRLESFELDKPGAFKDWRVVLRGPTLMLISPAGWTHSQPSKRDTKASSVVIEIPRADVILRWTSDEADVDLIAKGVTKYESAPLGPPLPAIDPEKSILSQVPAHQVGD